MKVVVIGSKGFIGQHLVKHFKSNGHSVWGADVVVDYAEADTYFLIDASNSDFNNVFQNNEFDLCVNCSGAASVPDSIKNPMRDYYLNTVNVFNILSAINKYQSACQFINLGSAAVYGNPQQLPIKESDPTGPLSPYGIHKHQAEQICEEFHRFFGIKTCSLRIFSVYGTGLMKQLFWDLNKKTETKGSIELFGTGEESRDFIHVDDLVRAIELVAKNTSFEAEIINIANGVEVKIKDAVGIFFGFYNEKVDYRFSGSNRKGDPLNWRADISRLQELGYKPEVDINDGLKDYYKWVKSIN
ncbi:NAD-dependent epimerase/dehydratase family protein [Carboxylicivirga sp. N1Y90]|uniref:NAD-dependent epimerase/dehydratase family protein n=1 Tax=Carboxylicivirga fragile TaxID=3417571 RepID=UPI003D34DC65|nr:NAD-dependent epimerase/dehydratase family protein [Marinilabiliaceae bacterium N1Y90]